MPIYMTTPHLAQPTAQHKPLWSNHYSQHCGSHKYARISLALCLCCRRHSIMPGSYGYIHIYIYIYMYMV